MSEREVMTRRGFLRGGITKALRGAGEALRAPVERAAPAKYLRPPGASLEIEFLSQCTRCGDCVPVCPAGAITLLGPGAGLAAKTPVVTPRMQACVMCTGLQCIEACEPGALQRDPEGASPKIGLAKIDAGRCWAAQGQDCDYCLRDCARHVSALRARPGEAPEIDPQRCDGCGLCEYICPVPGPAAIRVRPIKEHT